MEYFYNNVLNWSATDPINENFDTVGLGSTLFIYYIDSMKIFICMYPLLVFVYLVLQYCCGNKNKKSCRFKTKEKLRKCLFWGQPIVTITEGFNVISMCTFINL